MEDDDLKVFFYGSFMDVDLLRTRGVVPKAFEVAMLKHWDIVFSPLATLVSNQARSVYGIVADLSRTDIELLYSGEELKSYRPIEVIVKMRRNKSVRAQCYISQPTPGPKPPADYLHRVIAAAQNLGFPSAYLHRLKQFLER